MSVLFQLTKLDLTRVLSGFAKAAKTKSATSNRKKQPKKRGGK